MENFLVRLEQVLHDASIRQLVVDYEISFVLEEYKIRLGSGLEVRRDDDVLWSGLAEQAALEPGVQILAQQTRATLQSASVDRRSKSLTLNFSTGVSVTAFANDDYESWQIESADREFLVVCIPGGDLTWWGDLNEATD